MSCHMVCIAQAAAALASGHTSALALNRGRFLVHAAPAPNNINWQVSEVGRHHRRPVVSLENQCMEQCTVPFNRPSLPCYSRTEVVMQACVMHIWVAFSYWHNDTSSAFPDRYHRYHYHYHHHHHHHRSATHKIILRAR
jgi:hypothetical protein